MISQVRHLKSCSPNSCYFYATTVYCHHLMYSNTWCCLFVGRQEWLLKGSVHRTCQTHHLQLSSLKIFWAHDHWWVQPWLESGEESRFCGKFNSPILVRFVSRFLQGEWTTDVSTLHCALHCVLCFPLNVRMFGTFYWRLGILRLLPALPIIIVRVSSSDAILWFGSGFEFCTFLSSMPLLEYIAKIQCSPQNSSILAHKMHQWSGIVVGV